MPKVSICIPTYNRVQLLPFAINSVLQQSFTDFELIVCDDGSTDQTPDLMTQITDSRIRYIRHPQNIGRSENMRSGFAAAQGTYFIKFDDDDALTPHFLTKTVGVLDAHPEVDFVCTNHWIINAQGDRMTSATVENSEKWGKSRLQRGIIPHLIVETFQHQSLQVGSTLFRRNCLVEVDYMRPEADGCEDFDLLVRLAIAGKCGYFLPEFLMEYRFHGGQTSLKQNIHFLSAKLFCLSSYHFSEPELEKSRLIKLAGTQKALALRLIESGEGSRGRQFLAESRHILGPSRQGTIGWMLSYLPTSWRHSAFQLFRQLRPKDYTERVREQSD